MFVATMVAPDRLSGDEIDEIVGHLASAGASINGWAWIDAGKAADIRFSRIEIAEARSLLESLADGNDVIVQSESGRRKKLLIADMDSTMITIECIDELADYAGIKEEVAKVTEAAMRGEVDFEGALRRRVALLKGLASDMLERCYAERVRLTPGARTLVRTMAARGAHSILISGGFTFFADRVGREIGFAQVVANELGLEKGELSGMVQGGIVDSAVKRATLVKEAADRDIDLAQCLAVGDGANDIPMIEAAGLGVAFHAKPRTIAAADAAIRHGDLTVLLYAQGIPRSEWVESTSC